MAFGLMSFLLLAMPLSGRPLSVLGVNCRHVLLYNLGLQQLYSNQPAAAFDSLLEVLQVYHANPRLWLRLAEACIAAHAKVAPPYFLFYVLAPFHVSGGERDGVCLLLLCL